MIVCSDVCKTSLTYFGVKWSIYWLTFAYKNISWTIRTTKSSNENQFNLDEPDAIQNYFSIKDEQSFLTASIMVVVSCGQF